MRRSAFQVDKNPVYRPSMLEIFRNLFVEQSVGVLELIDCVPDWRPSQRDKAPVARASVDLEWVRSSSTGLSGAVGI